MEAISVKNLSVAYENNTIIEDLSLSIPKGKISIIIGANGCGKSTFLKTLARINKPKAGEIFINKKDIKKINEKNIAKEVAFLPQGPVCPSGLTVRELVAFGRFPHQKLIGGLNSHDKKVIDWAIKETGLSEFADREVENLSGGQRQRVSIARALLKNAPILVLDEATSALDSQNELMIQKSLANAMHGKTTLVIAHRLSTLRNMNKIIVIKNGKIVESGNHKQLLRKDGEYKKLWNLQTSGVVS